MDPRADNSRMMPKAHVHAAIACLPLAACAGQPLIPIGYLDADHWAIAVPIGRTHTIISTLFVTQNAYPREALPEALLRFVEEDLAAGVK
jgi:hypothetical protein